MEVADWVEQMAVVAAAMAKAGAVKAREGSEESPPEDQEVEGLTVAVGRVLVEVAMAVEVAAGAQQKARQKAPRKGRQMVPQMEPLSAPRTECQRALLTGQPMG